MNSIWKVGIIIIAICQIIFVATSTLRKSDEAKSGIQQDSITEQLIHNLNEIAKLRTNDSIQNYHIEQIIIAVDSLIRYNEAKELTLSRDTIGVK